MSLFDSRFCDPNWEWLKCPKALTQRPTEKAQCRIFTELLCQISSDTLPTSKTIRGRMLLQPHWPLKHFQVAPFPLQYLVIYHLDYPKRLFLPFITKLMPFKSQLMWLLLKQDSLNPAKQTPLPVVCALRAPLVLWLVHVSLPRLQASQRQGSCLALVSTLPSSDTAWHVLHILGGWKDSRSTELQFCKSLCSL